MDPTTDLMNTGDEQTRKPYGHNHDAGDHYEGREINLALEWGGKFLREYSRDLSMHSQKEWSVLYSIEIQAVQAIRKAKRSDERTFIGE